MNFHSFRNLRLTKEQEIFSTIFGHFVWHANTRYSLCFHVRVSCSISTQEERRQESRRHRLALLKGPRSNLKKENQKKNQKWVWKYFCLCEQNTMQPTKQICSTLALLFSQKSKSRVIPEVVVQLCSTPKIFLYLTRFLFLTTTLVAKTCRDISLFSNFFCV